MAENQTEAGQLSRAEKKRQRQEEHERLLAEARQRKKEKKDKNRSQRFDKRRELSEKDGRHMSVKISMDNVKKAVEQHFSRQFPGVNHATWDSFTSSFNIEFKTETQATNAVKRLGKGSAIPLELPVTIEKKMNRGKSIYFGDPKLLSEKIKELPEAEYKKFIQRVVDKFKSNFGNVSRYDTVRNALVIEFADVASTQAALDRAEDNPDEMALDEVSFLPIFPGLPKRNFETTKRKLLAHQENLEEEKNKRQRTEAEAAAEKAAAAAAQGGFIPDQAQHYAPWPGYGFGPPPAQQMAGAPTPKKAKKNKKKANGGAATGPYHPYQAPYGAGAPPPGYPPYGAFPAHAYPPYGAPYGPHGGYDETQAV